MQSKIPRFSKENRGYKQRLQHPSRAKLSVRWDWNIFAIREGDTNK